MSMKVPPRVTAMLAFVPKTAGFISILLLCATIGWQYVPGGETAAHARRGRAECWWHRGEPIRVLLWVIAAMTMTVGNVLAVMQTSIKRMLAYSSIALRLHACWRDRQAGNNTFATSGVSAVMFYLLVYGVMNVAPWRWWLRWRSQRVGRMIRPNQRRWTICVVFGSVAQRLCQHD